LQTVAAGEVVGVDPRLVNIDSFREIEGAVAPKGASLKAVWDNLVDKVWDNKPVPSKNPVIVLPKDKAGVTIDEKFNRVRAEMKKVGVASLVLSALDDIACTFFLPFLP
jgi:Xaa-Pro aminopeptidase